MPPDTALAGIIGGEENPQAIFTMIHYRHNGWRWGNLSFEDGGFGEEA